MTEEFAYQYQKVIKRQNLRKHVVYHILRLPGHFCDAHALACIL